MANFFDQFDPAPQQQAAPNFFDQFDAPASQQAEPKTALPQINIPGIGRPSLIGMAKGLLSGVQSATMLPRDVYQGKVDPLSEEGIKRALDMAAMTALPSAGRTMAVRAAESAPTAVELKAAASPVYQDLTKAGNAVKLEPEAAGSISKGITSSLDEAALRQANAPRTYRELNRISGAQDLNDIAIARDKMRDIANGISENRLIRVAGPDAKAARDAMTALDAEIEKLSPGWVKQNAIADSNWAAARRIDKVVKEADKGQKGRLGSFDANESRAKGYAPEEIAAIKKAHQGGMLGTGLNAIGGGFNPFHGGVTGAVSAAMHLPAAIASGGLSLLGIPAGMIADAMAKGLRGKALREAIEKLGSRSALGQERAATGGGILQLPQLAAPPPTLGLLPYANRPANPYQ